MALPAAGNSLSFDQIRYEFGPRIGQASIGSYRVNYTTVPQGGSLTNLPLDEGVPQSGQQIGVGSFFNKRLNVLVNYFSGTTVFRSTARADFDSQNIVVVGGLLDPGTATTTSSGRRVIAHVNKSIGSQKSAINPYICALRTGNGWETDTDLEFEVGSSGQIAGSGGDGGDAGFTVSGRNPVTFVNSFGGTSVSSIPLSGLQGGDLVILVSAGSTEITVGAGLTSVGDHPLPSGFNELNANKLSPNGDPAFPYFKVSYKVMPSPPDTEITGLLSNNSIHVASAFRGVQSFSGGLQYAGSPTGTTVTFPTVDVDAQSLVFVYGIVKDDNIAPVVASGGYSPIDAVDFGTGNNVDPGCTLILGFANSTAVPIPPAVVPVSPGSFTSASWDGDGWVSGSIPLGGIALGLSNENGSTGTSALGIEYPCAINNNGLIISGSGGGGAGGDGRGYTHARTQDGCEGFGRYIYAGGGGGGGGRGLPAGTGGTASLTPTENGNLWRRAQNGFDGTLTSGGGGGAGGYSGYGNCWVEAVGGNGGAAGVSGGSGGTEANIPPIGGFGGNGAAIVVNGGVPYTPPTGNPPIGDIVTATVS